MPNPIAPKASRTYRPRLALAAPEFGIPYLVEAEILAQKHHGRHSHREFQVLFVVEGAMGMEVESTPHDLPAGAVCVLPPGVVHGVVEPTGGSERAVVVDLRLANDAGLHLTQVVARLGGGPAYACDVGEVVRFADGLRRAAESMSGNPAKLLACVWGLIGLIDAPLDETVGEHAVPTAPCAAARTDPGNIPVDPRLVAAETFMADHLAQPIGVDAIAAEAGLSRSQLTRLYLASSGVAPATRLRTLRVERAKQLLVGSTLSVKEVARVCGFPSQNHFSRVYQQVTGRRPVDER